MYVIFEPEGLSSACTASDLFNMQLNELYTLTHISTLISQSVCLTRSSVLFWGVYKHGPLCVDFRIFPTYEDAPG